MTDEVDVPLPADDPAVAADQSPADAIRSLGFDPDLVQAVILTPTSAVAIGADYPEPLRAPEES